MTQKITAIYPGTFDPVTRGHLDIMQRALGFCDQLIIGIAAHSNKKHLYTLKIRQKMIEKMIEVENLNHKIKVKPILGLTVDFVKQHNTQLIIRGLRNSSDFNQEFQMVHANKLLDPTIETIFLTAAPDHNGISSSVVRQILAAGGDISQFIHDAITPYI